jgi:hypothetical protein
MYVYAGTLYTMITRMLLRILYVFFFRVCCRFIVWGGVGGKVVHFWIQSYHWRALDTPYALIYGLNYATACACLYDTSMLASLIYL